MEEKEIEKLASEFASNNQLSDEFYKIHQFEHTKQAFMIGFKKALLINGVGNCKTEPNLNRLETELGKLQKVHGEITKHFELHSGCYSFKFKDGAVYRVKIERNQTKATLD